MDRKEQIRQFLESISMVESSGGKNFKHRPIESGIHKGHQAIGRYGLMPNTVDEMVNRMRSSGVSDDELQKLKAMDFREKKQFLEANPEQEQRIAEYMADRQLSRYPDDKMAAYSWLYGHNYSPEDIAKKDYIEDDYVQKYLNYFPELKRAMVGKKKMPTEE